MGKEASVGLRNTVQPGLYFRGLLGASTPVQCLSVAGTGSEMTGPPFYSERCSRKGPGLEVRQT